MTHDTALTIEESKGVSVVEVLASPRRADGGLEVETSAGVLPISNGCALPMAALAVGALILVAEGVIIA